MDEWRRGWRERGRKIGSDREGREASPVRGLRASWKLSFGLGPSAVVELSCSFICFRLCDFRQKVWPPLLCLVGCGTYTHTKKKKPTHNHKLKTLSHTTDSIFNFSVWTFLVAVWRQQQRQHQCQHYSTKDKVWFGWKPTHSGIFKLS